MARVDTAHGSFEPPPGWTILEDTAADGPIVDGEARRSLVLHGDLPLAGKGPAEYVAMQQVLLPGVLDGYAPIESRALSDDPRGPWLLHHRIDAPGEPSLLQGQVYFFDDDRVAILTATGPSEGSGDLLALLFRAAGSFAFPERGSTEHGELRHDAHHHEEHQHQGDDHQ